jgi:subtilase family serine protease
MLFRMVPPAPRPIPLLLLLCIMAAVCQSVPANAESSPNSPNPQATQPRDRITRYIDDEQRVVLYGNRHPLAAPQYDAGEVEPEFLMERMVLTLQPDSAQRAALVELLDEQHNPESPYYHQWLTPGQFADRFGVSEADAAQITAWLESHGFEVEEVAAGSLSITFSGTAEQVESAFHTQIHAYKIGAEVHHANATDPEIPAALGEVVGGIVSLNDFRIQAQNTGARLPAPEFTSGGSYYLAPADFATIYNVNPAYQQAITGSGQSVAIVARSNINIADVRQFRSAFALPANDPLIIVNGTDPGIWSSAEETEADLDVEWAGAVAKAATIKFVVSKSTNSTDGADLSAQYIVNHSLSPVLTMSFAECEAALGSSGNSFFNNLWQQAATEGITVLVSSGDNGAAGCDLASATLATHGLAVNGICSTPYSVCVGGAEFTDSNGSLYWSPTNASGTELSALSYIPEIAWNESGPSIGLWSTSGGASAIYSKPAWQNGMGVPSDGRRDVPDVSLTGAGHDGYLIYQNGGLYVVGGTSASAPSFAGLMALVVQNAAARQGNANTVFYSLATKQKAGGAAVFHDIVTGNNSVPGQSGFKAATGYDQTTGLGSVNASVLVGHWSDASAATPAFQATDSASTLSVAARSTNSLSIKVAISGGFNAAVAFSVTGLPTGVTAAFKPASLVAPGSGNSTLTLTAASGVTGGVYSTTISATSGGTTERIPLSLTVKRLSTLANRPLARQ